MVDARSRRRTTRNNNLSTLGKIYFVFMAALFTLAAMQETVCAQQATATSAKRNKAIAHRPFDEVFNQGKLDVVDKIFAPNYVGHSSASLTGPIQGPQGIKQFVTMYCTAFPDIHFAFEEILVDGNKVIVRWITRGTHTGELQGIRPTGKQMTVTGIGIAHIVEGRIIRSFSKVSLLNMFQQLGAVPPLEQILRRS
jgi:predicted ester cyclase